MKVIITFEDVDEGVAVQAEFDPPIDSLSADEKGKVLLSPAVVLADIAYSAASSQEPMESEGCSGGCTDCPCRS